MKKTKITCMHFLGRFTAATLCAAVLLWLPNPTVPSPEDGKPGILCPADGDGETREPGIDPQNDLEPLDEIPN